MKKKLYLINNNCTFKWVPLAFLFTLVGIALLVVPITATAQSCDCTDYIYLNDQFATTNQIHKFEINSATGVLTEIGSPWVSGINNPHGIAADKNGFLYFTAFSGTTFDTETFYQADCEGNIISSSLFNDEIISGDLGAITNLASKDNVIYSNHSLGGIINALDICTDEILGSVDLNTPLGEAWGLTMGKDGFLYATSYRFPQTTHQVYKIDPDLSNFTMPATVVTPHFTIDVTPYSGQGAGGYVAGIDVDENGNIYVVSYADGPGATTVIKVDQSGTVLGTITDATNDGTGFYGAIGIAYSQTTGHIYVTSLEDCISVIDANTLTYIPALAVAGGEGKGLRVVTECCPSTSFTVNETICSSGNGEQVFLQDILDCGDGFVCEGQWTEVTNTSGGNIVFDACNLSITVNGSGCATYTLEKNTVASGNQQCGMFSITVNICTEVPTAVVASSEGTCASSTPNDDATIEITAVVGATEANYSLGNTYTTPALGTNIDVSGGSGTFTGLMHDIEYTVRVFSSGGCFTDYTLTSASIVCATYSLGSTIFEDTNNNGIQDGGENGIGLVIVELYDGVGTLIDIGPDGILGTADDNMGMPYLASANGDYFFQNLAAGMYQVQLPATAFGAGQPLETINISSTPTDTNDNEEDEDDNGSQAGGAGTVIVSPIITLGEADGEPTGVSESGQGGTADDTDDALGDMTVDFGLFAPVSLGDTTWVDTNMDGLQDLGEPFLQGMTVTLFNSDGTPVTLDAEGNAYTNTTTTNALSFYEFTNLPPGNYYVVFDISTVAGSEFYTFTINTGGDETDDSDADPSSGQSDNTGAIGSGERFPDLDAGVVCNVTAEAGTGQTICATGAVDLTTLGASFTPTGVTGFGATWTSSTGGTFDDGAGEFGVATTYTISAADITAGQVILTLTTDDPSAPPFNAIACGPATDEVLIIILDVDCGAFPWGGN